MKVISQKDLDNQIKKLENKNQKIMDNIESLNRRDKNNEIQNLTKDWSECYLDLYHLRKFNIDYDSDPYYLRLTNIRDNMFKLFR